MPPNSCLDLLTAMVGFDSVVPRTSGRADAELQLGEYLAGVAGQWGLAQRWLHVPGCAPNLLIEHRTDPAAPWLLFDSHLDTVGVAGMTVEPFQITAREGRLYGRGTCDTKGTGAAMFWALREYARSGVRGPNVALLFSVGEEDQQIGARTFVSQHLRSLGWKPAAIVVGEPTRMNVVAGTNGFVRWQIRTTGKAAHSSAPHQGRNAIADMARVIVALEDDYIAPLGASHPLTGNAACCITRIHGGVQVNIVPESCVLDIDRRVAPGEELADVIPAVQRVLQPLLDADPDLRLFHEHAESAPPLDPEPNLPLAKKCVATLHAAGIDSQITGAPYTTNANHYGVANLPTVILGPGDIAQAHTAEEWIEEEQLELGVRGYRAIIQSRISA